MSQNYFKKQEIVGKILKAQWILRGELKHQKTLTKKFRQSMPSYCKACDAEVTHWKNEIKNLKIKYCQMSLYLKTMWGENEIKNLPNLKSEDIDSVYQEIVEHELENDISYEELAHQSFYSENL